MWMSEGAPHHLRQKPPRSEARRDAGNTGLLLNTIFMINPLSQEGADARRYKYIWGGGGSTELGSERTTGCTSQVC